MDFPSKQIFSWLLVLILAISPIQVTMAIDVDLDGHGERCQMNSMPSHDSVDMDLKINSPMEHGDHCKDHPSCVGQVSSSSMQAPFSLLFVARTSGHYKFIMENEDVQTVYPSQLKRPPKA
jgi:hypothetical protein